MAEGGILSEEEFTGILRQALRHPEEYKALRATLEDGGFVASQWMGVLAVEVNGRLLSAREAYAALEADPELMDRIYKEYLSAWR